MNVKELLGNVNIKQTVDIMCNFPGFFDMIDWDKRLCENKKKDLKEKAKNRFIEEYNKILESDVIESRDKYLIVSERKEKSLNDDSKYDIYYNVSMMNLSELDRIKDGILVDDIFEFKNPLYDVMFSSRQEILGMNVAKVNFNRYSNELIAACILHLLTSFAIDEDERTEKIEEIENSLKQSLDDMKNGGKTYSSDELRKMLGLEEETEEEKERRRIEAKERAEIFITYTINLIKDALIAENIEI